jgi:hydroxymethylglutaryl-CoA synthase
MNAGMNVGIVGYGAYIPRYRIKLSELASSSGKDFERISSSLAVEEKSVPAPDEDSVTFAVSAAQNAIARSGVQANEINAIFVGSESPAYAVKPTATIVGQALGVNKFSSAADVEFACKAGTAALGICAAMVKSGMAKFGLAIGTDVALGAPGDILEFGAGAGAAAMLVGSDHTKIIALIEDSISSVTDTPDFWRRNLQKYPQHVGRFTAEPAYFKHVCLTADEIIKKNNLNPKDFDHVIFHQPNGKFPLTAAKILGFEKHQLEAGMLAWQIGNTYSACSLLGLTAVFDLARADQKVLLVSYGSGSGSDAFIFKTTKNIEKLNSLVTNTRQYIENKVYLSNSEYRRNLDLIG